MFILLRASLLLLAPLGFLALFVGNRISTQALSRARRAGSLAVRCLLVLLLTCALGGPVWTHITDLRRHTVFLVDVSESVPAAARDRALAELKPQWDREVAEGNLCSMMAFAGASRVLIPPGRAPLQIPAIPTDDGLRRSATDFSSAFAAARTLFQSQAANRIVVLTDGLESTQPANRVEIPPDTLAVPLTEDRGNDLAIVDVQAPLAVRSGEPFDVRVSVATERAGEFGLSVVLDNEALPGASKRYSAPGPGRHVVMLPPLQQKTSFASGLHKLLVMAEAPGDREPRNNIGLATLTVTGKPKVLLVEGSPRDGEFLSRVLKAQDIDFARQSPAEFSTRSETLDEFVAIILAGVARETLPTPSVNALKSFVEQSGGGLWVVGSPALQGARGYAGTDLEKLLPVSFSDAVAPLAEAPPQKEAPPPAQPPPPPPQQPDIEDAKTAKVLAPTIAMLLLVDKSGSMAGRNIELVKETCIATASALGRRDLIGVVAFDHNPHPILEFTEAGRIDYVKQRILRLFADGGTRIHPALEMAERLFQLDARAQSSAIKHAVLLSDGDAPPADYETVVKRLVDEGVTVSTVCVSGAKFDPGLMSQIAQWGRGRFYFAASFQKVPELIATETQKIIGLLPKDDKNPPPPAPAPKSDPPPKPAQPPPTPPKPDSPPPLQPVVLKDAHEILAGIDGRNLPGLRGRLIAVAKPKADVPLATQEGQAVLALGRQGLGKTAVWASDLSGPWSTDWVAWKDTPKLMAQLVRFISGSGPDAELAGRVRLEREGSAAALTIDAAGPGGALSVTDAAGAPLPIETNSDAEGVVHIRLPRPGEPVRLLLQRADGKKLALGAVRAYDEEFAPREPSRDLFANGLATVEAQELHRRLGEERVAGEERRDLTPWLVIAALFLLPLDVALRRLMPG